MRIVISLVLSLPLLLSAAAHADEVKPPRDKLALVTDGKGHYVAVVPFSSDDDTLFYGDGKRFYSLPVQGGGSSGDTRFDRTFVDPRYGWGVEHQFSFNKGEDGKSDRWEVVCDKRTTALQPVADAERAKIVAAATFESSPRDRRAYALARDDHGRYYFVDRGRTPQTEKNFRLYVGPKGNLKLQKMTNVVSDSEGDIFSTKTGSLRLILGKNESSWIRHKKTTPLTIVPIEDNVPMIYNELGVYSGKRLGTPCDDL